MSRLEHPDLDADGDERGRSAQRRRWGALAVFQGTLNPPSTGSAGVRRCNMAAGSGGFGMGDADDATVLSDMVSNYSTVFTRKTFTCYNVSTVSKFRFSTSTTTASWYT
jgi:hypothetical protein